MAEQTTPVNGNGNGNGNGHGAAPVDLTLGQGGAPAATFDRFVILTRDLSSDEVAVALIVHGQRLVTLQAADWASAQREAVRLLEERSADSDDTA